MTWPLARSTIAIWLFSWSVSDDLVLAVDVDEFGLGILGRDGGEAGEVDHLPGGAIDRAVGADREGRQIAARQLRDGAFIDLLVALVLDGDGEERAVRALGERIGLPAEIAGGLDRSCVARSTTAR